MVYFNWRDVLPSGGLDAVRFGVGPCRARIFCLALLRRWDIGWLISVLRRLHCASYGPLCLRKGLNCCPLLLNRIQNCTLPDGGYSLRVLPTSAMISWPSILLPS